ncbi:hypothetical protein SDC9_06980 [bioreactor metagenome]|jgi:Uncharacterized protein conserved in bacteria|uniref:Metallopeptidase family protein n=2 Tax=root TaxID=1 RepID=A0AB33HMT7_9CHLR|nr:MULTISPECIES: metallopeptidase family protein [Dehalococcoides]AQU02523.1 hypothetical protein B1773_00200 [Dehalococcoides mccartyi]AQU03886.1 hypothetical protein B1774_00200 [Dehalococcoides mccartyi]MEA4878687.1 metallopeptidase family protein [Dehalococcoides mccartyi]OBW60802.1 MAG: hypothetical protein A9181_05815 [Dehalococcoides mccartyi]POZ59270.1 hypothetical protein C1O63_0583 [Dehalococcoides mccartyi]
MDTEQFKQIVAEAVDSLPEEFLALLDNVEIMVADRPSQIQRRNLDMHRGEELLGLYEGVPLTERHASYGMVTPDRITIFRLAILDMVKTEEDIKNEVRRVVKHEVAHHFGISDERLEEMGGPV